MNSGWDAHVSSDKFRGADAEGKQHYPGFHVEAAQMLLEESTAIGIASDTLSLDHGISANFATHYAWLPTNRWGLENVANLGELPAVGATIMARRQRRPVPRGRPGLKVRQRGLPLAGFQAE
jgi:kynurenine formamidase